MTTEPDAGGTDAVDSRASDSDAENAKLVVLARFSRARAGTAEGAAVRDTDGRTYVAATVDLPSLRLSALQGAVAAAAGSGAVGIEAAAVVTTGNAGDIDVVAVADLGGSGTPVLVAGPDGTVIATVTA